tara:strand:- start:1188 stop:1460 length:273 start_codon:yes stop_codon:yes gene_type:complete
MGSKNIFLAETERLFALLELLELENITKIPHPGKKYFPTTWNLMMDEIENLPRFSPPFTPKSLEIQIFYSLGSYEISELNKYKFISKLHL